MRATRPGDPPRESADSTTHSNTKELILESEQVNISVTTSLIKYSLNISIDIGHRITVADTVALSVQLFSFSRSFGHKFDQTIS